MATAAIAWEVADTTSIVASFGALMSSASGRSAHISQPGVFRLGRAALTSLTAVGAATARRVRLLPELVKALSRLA